MVSIFLQGLRRRYGDSSLQAEGAIEFLKETVPMVTILYFLVVFLFVRLFVCLFVCLFCFGLVWFARSFFACLMTSYTHL